jgi:ABC-type nitrate/sulfonate/bicarbonate transport system substrate-binding protein
MIVARLLRGVRLVAALAIVSVLLAPPALQAQALTVVTVGTLSSDNSAAVYYAQELGFFKQAGLDVHISAIRTRRSRRPRI